MAGLKGKGSAQGSSGIALPATPRASMPAVIVALSSSMPKAHKLGRSYGAFFAVILVAPKQVFGGRFFV